jgi:isopenicillin-N N-acyltransferase-like protein
LSKPFHVRCYEILRAQDLEDAVQTITGSGRACSTNFLIAQVPDRVSDIEASPHQTRTITPENGYLIHTNHFLDPSALGVVEPPRERWSSTCHRLERLTAQLASKHPVTIKDLQGYLSDHQMYPHSICCHEDVDLPRGEHYRTVTSVVMDLHARELHISDGPPCQSAYQRFVL